MNGLISYLGNHRALTTMFVATYSVVTIAGHDLAQEIVFWLQDVFGPNRWLRYVAIAFGAGALIGLTWLVRQARRRDDTVVLAFYWLVTTLFALIGYGYLMMFANECVHFVQYAVLAVLIYPLTRRFGETVIWCALVGGIDEGYQYLVLHHQPGTYFDINDALLNVVGAGFGVIALRAVLPPRPRLPVAYLVRTPGVVAIVLLFAVAITAWLAGFLHLEPSAEASGLVLRRGPVPVEFWRYSRFDRPFHEIQLWPGLVALLTLLTFYHGLDVLQLPNQGQDVASSEGTDDHATVSSAPDGKTATS